MLAKPVEMYNMLRILRPDAFANFVDFGNRYCGPYMTPYGMEYKGSSCTTELHFMLKSHLMIRRLKVDVLHELPAKRRQKIQVTVDSSLLEKIKVIMREMEKDIDKSGDPEKHCKLKEKDGSEDDEKHGSQDGN